MSQTLSFVIGMVARLISLILSNYSDWLLHKVAEGTDEVIGFLFELQEFGQWLVAAIAEQFCGRRRYRPYGHEYEPELYGR
jgi:hypothetical protein